MEQAASASAAVPAVLTGKPVGILSVSQDQPAVTTHSTQISHRIDMHESSPLTTCVQHTHCMQGELSQQATERARLVAPFKEALLGLKAAKQAEERMRTENKGLREAASQLRTTQVHCCAPAAAILLHRGAAC